MVEATDSIDLLSELRSIDPESKIIATTYNFDQFVFEKHIFPVFQNRTFPLLLLDYNQYQSMLSQFKTSRFAETKYFLVPVKIKGSFHPKVVLSIGEDEVVLIIGSANLTPQGLATNAEICGSLTFDTEDVSTQALVRDVVQFFTGLKEYISSEPHRNEIEKTLSRFSFKDDLIESEDTFFLHNLEAPIFSQLRKIIDEDIDEIIVLSPFYSSKVDIIKKFQDSFSETITFFFDPNNHNFPVDEVQKYENRNKLKFFLINFHKNRSLHAKIVLFIGKKKSYCLFGSANFTEPGLLLTPKNGGNIECCILRAENDPGHFDYLISSSVFSKKKCTLEVAMGTHLDPAGQYKADFRILQASISEGRLLLRIDHKSDSEAIALVKFGRFTKEVVVGAGIDEIELQLTAEELEGLNTAVIVEVELNEESSVLKSDRILICNPQYLPAGYSALQGITCEDESIWLFKMLNRYAHLPSFNDFFPFIERLSEYDFFDKDPDSREAFLLKNQRHLLNVKPYSPETKLKVIIERFRKRHKTRLQNALKQDPSSAFPIVVNSFLMISKLFLWSVSSDLQDVSYLRYIKGIMETLAVNEGNIVEKVDAEALKNSRLLEHLVILSYFVDTFHRNSNEFQKRNFHTRAGRNYVKETIDKGFIEAIDAVRVKVLAENLSRESIESTLLEYQFTVSNINVSSEDVIQSINEMIGRVNKTTSAFHQYPLIET